jgi:hypothetical protein
LPRSRSRSCGPTGRRRNKYRRPFATDRSAAGGRAASAARVPDRTIVGRTSRRASSARLMIDNARRCRRVQTEPYAEKRAACGCKRPKSREETPKEGGGNARRYRTATTYIAAHK